MSTELDEFKIEILELLEQAEKALLHFDQLGDSESSPQHYDEVFRAYHNIKGAAGMMDWPELQHHVHQLENVLMQSKDSSSIPRNLISWFLKGNDATRCIVNGEAAEFSFDTTETQSGTPEIKEKVEKSVEPSDEFYAEVKEANDRICETLIKLESTGSDSQLVDSLYRDIHSVKGACQLFGFVEASRLFHAMESSLEGIRQSQAPMIDKAHVNTLLLCLDLMQICLQSSAEDGTKKEVNFMVNLLAPFEHAHALDEKINENTEAPVKVEVKAVQAVQPVIEMKKAAPPAAAQGTAESDKQDSTIRVQVSLLDRLMTLMGEMVLVRNQVLQYSNKTDDLEFLNLSQKLDVVTSELQEETMKTRMQPIGNILSKFQRVVRDLSGTLDKKINLSLFGTETELDKTLIESVKDPLTHIVRNSCDHGIETPEQRRLAGKPESGTIKIKAYHESGQVVVEISDDGRGLSRAKLLKKAIEKGIVDPARAEKMSDREVQYLIFAPGFSTAEQVTNVSGRGVGMDVVKSNIEKIGGIVEISSEEGVGTSIILKIPLTLAIVPAMIVRSGEDRFAIPQVKLVELVRIEKSSIEQVQGRKIYRLRGNVLPLVDFSEVLGRGEGSLSTEAVNVVVLNSDKHLFGLIVDEILDTADIVVKPLARFLKSINIYSGATVLGDGNVSFIMDVSGIATKHLGAGVHSEDQKHGDKYFDSIESGELREFVLLKLGSQSKHALPLSFVSRMEEFKTSAIEFSGHQRVIRYRDGILKLVSLNDMLGYPKSVVEKEVIQVIVAKYNEVVIGLEVDQIIDVLSTRDHVTPDDSSAGLISGTLVTSSEIIVLLDVEKILDQIKPPKKQDLEQPRILVVEDTDSIRNKICSDLQLEGWEIEVARDGVEALKKIVDFKGKFSLIISDIEMPRMGGYEFARKVREITVLKSTPIIAFTTKNTAKDVAEAKAAGFTTYLEKSKASLLPLLINECLGSSQKRKIA